MTQRTCRDCGEVLPTQTIGRRRILCESCSPPRRRNPRPSTPPKVAGDGPVTSTTRAAIEVADRWSDPLSALAINLAQRIDAGQEPGSALANLAKALRDTLAALDPSDAAHDDPIDQLMQRRTERLQRRWG